MDENTNTIEEVINDNEVTEDLDDMISNFSMDQIDAIPDMLKMVKESLTIFEQVWNDTRKTYELTDKQMIAVSQFNKTHKDPKPEGYDEDKIENEEDKYDPFNGIDKMSEEDVTEIFGENSKIKGLSHNLTLEHIKEAAKELTDYVEARENYHQMSRAYLMLVDTREEYELSQLLIEAQKHDNEEVKQKVIDQVNYIRDQKNVAFLANEDDLTERELDYIISAYDEEKKIQYLMNRTLDKMERIGLSSGMLVEFNNFEKRYLPEKYHKYTNMLLVYLLRLIAYSNPNNKNDNLANNARSLMLAIDGVTRNSLTDERKQNIIDNVIAFEEKVYNRINNKK